MTTDRLTNLFIGLGLLLGFATLYVLATMPQQVFGSVPETQEYQATTTYAAQVPTERKLKEGRGALAQVTITGDNTGLMTLYNATTSDVNKRTGNPATSTILIADFPTAAPEGTYTFDAVFTTGLLLVTSGTPATSTITYR